MPSEIRVPSPGESISEVLLAAWLKEEGELVEVDEEIAELESEKATLMVVADRAGVLHQLVEAGETVRVGAPLARIEESAQGEETTRTLPKQETSAEEAASDTHQGSVLPAEAVDVQTRRNWPSPAAARLIDEHGLDAASITGSGKDGRITKSDVLDHLESGKDKTVETPAALPPAAATLTQKTADHSDRKETRRPLSQLRKKLAQRMVATRNQTAMLTTFNEVDMGAVLELRREAGAAFKEKYGIKLGLVGFFVLAACRALQEFPLVNSYLEDGEIVGHDYMDIGVAVSAPKGLLVPVIRDVQKLNLPEVERKVQEHAEKARNNRLTIEEMSGGTFTVSNGGVFGSLLSTPLLNPPQCAILGMHTIQERPVARQGQVVIRPMMYVALSYDHRLIDGRESVGFLKRIKEQVESPARLLLGV